MIARTESEFSGAGCGSGLGEIKGLRCGSVNNYEAHKENHEFMHRFGAGRRTRDSVIIHHEQEEGLVMIMDLRHFIIWALGVECYTPHLINNKSRPLPNPKPNRPTHLLPLVIIKLPTSPLKHL